MLRFLRRGRSALENYVRAAPSDEQTVRLFEGEWASQLPGVEGGGASELFDDGRIRFAAECFGGFEGKKVLELGPLEAGHSYMMHARGAREIVAVEGNTRAYLKCLVVKELYGLSRARFLLGDFSAFLQEHDEAYDVVVASGVLYHMMRPLELLDLVAPRSQHILLWTHYYDESVIRERPEVKARFRAPETVDVDGVGIPHYPYIYGRATRGMGFCGGPERSSRWLERSVILEALSRHGFNRIEVADDDPHHPHGPAVTLACTKA